VGCHHKTTNRTKPLGNIPNQEIRNARKNIHALLDPMWQNEEDKYCKRGSIYKYLSNELGYEYHTAEIKTIKEARKVYKLLKNYENEKFS
jgi:predicted solute-binding protein